MTQPLETPYSSPPRKLIRFFEKSRDQWKSKCQTAKATVKRLQNRVRFLERSKAQWKERAQQLEAEVARLRVQRRDSESVWADGPEKKTPSPSQ